MEGKAELSVQTHLDSLVLKHLLHHVPITPQHARMMYPKARIKQLLHLLVPTRPYLLPVKLKLGMIRRLKERSHAFFHRRFLDLDRTLDRLFACMDKYHDLMSVLHHLRDLVKDDLVKVACLLR